jgi:hypothetical protein
MRLMIAVLVLVLLVIVDQTQFRGHYTAERPDYSNILLLNWACRPGCGHVFTLCFGAQS